MLPAYARALTRARSCLAALADTAPSITASSSYERALIMLDRIHTDAVPPLDAACVPDNATELHAAAAAAIEGLVAYGVDALEVELVLALLREACVPDDR